MNYTLTISLKVSSGMEYVSSLAETVTAALPTKAYHKVVQMTLLPSSIIVEGTFTGANSSDFLELATYLAKDLYTQADSVSLTVELKY